MVSPTAATFYVYKSFGSVLRSQALETPQMGFHELNGRKSCWTWPGSALKRPRPSPEPSRNPVEPDLALHQSLRDLLRNLLRNPVEPDLALHQSLTDLHRNLFQNPVEPDPALHQSLPDLLRNLPRNLLFSGTFSGTLLNLTWLCTKASPTFSGTFSGTLLKLTWLCTKASWNLLRNLLRNRVEPDLALHQSLPDLLREPSPEPCWTWPGSAPKPPGPSPENLDEPDPAPVHTGAILGRRPPLAYAVGEKTICFHFKIK